MKKHIRILSVFMALMLMMSVGIISASAVRAPVTFGNVDHESGIDVTDATIVQRTVAKLQNLDSYSAFAADVDDDGEVTVFDATMIQQYVAGMITEFPAGVGSFVDVYAEALVSDYNLGARVGTPVTFTAIAYGEAGPLLYQFYVNDEVVQEYSESNSYVHTFEEAGAYVVEYSVKNRAGIEVGEYLELTVTDPLDIGWINITSIYHKGFYDSKVTFEAVAEIGLTPYEFSFSLYDRTEAQPDDLFGLLVEEQDFCESNSFTLTQRLEDYHEYVLYVTVRDADGHTDTDSISFTYETPPPA